MIRLKNILAENMLRFGPKNLSESEKRNLRRLTEAAGVALNTLPDYAGATAVFKKQLIDKTPDSQVYVGTEALWLSKFFGTFPGGAASSGEYILKVRMLRLQPLTFQKNKDTGKYMYQFVYPVYIYPGDGDTFDLMYYPDSKPQFTWKNEGNSFQVPDYNEKPNEAVTSSDVSYINSAINSYADQYGVTAQHFIDMISKNPSNYNVEGIKTQANLAGLQKGLSGVAKQILDAILAM